MRKYIRVKVRGLTYLISQVSGKIYYFNRDKEKEQSELVSLQKAQRLATGDNVAPYWRKLAKEVLSEYNNVINGVVKKHAVDVF